MNYNTFMVISGKGGVGKTTTATQLLTAYLFDKYSKKGAVPSVDSQNKIKLYEVDKKNNSSLKFSKTNLFESKLVKNGSKAFEDILLKESNDFLREHSIVFDIGVGYFDEVIETLKDTIVEEKIIFVIPFKTAEDDFNNAVSAIEKIKSFDKKATIIPICSDAISDFSETDELEEEFAIVFGKAINYTTLSFNESLFKKTGIEKKYISLKKSALLDVTSYSCRITLYGASFEGDIIDPTNDKIHDLQKQLLEIRNDANKAIKDKNIALAKELSTKATVISQLMSLFKKCKNYREAHLIPIFKELDKMI